MASAIRILCEHNVGATVVQSHATWRPESRLRPIVGAVRTLIALQGREVAHIHLSERGSFLREGAVLALARRRGLVTVVTIHGASFGAFAGRHPRLVSTVLRRADLVICLEQGALEIVRRLAPKARAEIVPNAVALEGDPPPVDATDELVVFAGEIGLRKGADVLHRAWRLVAQRRPEARCLMVGPTGDFTPPHTERLEVRAPVGPAEMKAILLDARVVALPARAEAMPMVLTEAMSLGRPFVSTPVGGIPELAAAGGMLATVGDESELADRLTDVLADPGLARTIGERGRRFCMQTRSVAVIDTRLRELYRAAGEKR
ncbi:MAG: glycosyltransferase family 4 protein [Solirubrobacteraceae bacterium]